MAGKRGGARPGAGRKKITEKVKHETAIDLARKKVVDSLPAIVDAMIAAAKLGDVKAGIYLMDRALGKVAQAVEHTGKDGGEMLHKFTVAVEQFYGKPPETP